jgi:NitT/TauT family transport system permease protein
MSAPEAAALSPRTGLLRRKWLPQPSRRVLVGGTTTLTLLVVWELVVDLGLIDPLYIASPSLIALAGKASIQSGEIWRDIQVSANEFFLGYVTAILFAMPLGLAMGWSRRVSYVFGPFVDILNAVPRVTFLPILILWFGIGIWSKFAVVFLGAIIPIIIGCYTGVRASEARFMRVARSFGASPFKQMTSIVLPGTVPYIFTGLKYAAGRALLGVVVGELYAATAGLGHMILEAGNLFDTATVFFGVILFMATGIVITSVLSRLERHFDRWRPQEQR